MKIKLKNGTSYDVLDNTAIYPSYGSGRNRMEIHMVKDSMPFADFESLFTKENTSEIHFINGDSDVAYFDYSIVSSIGKERISITSNTTGEVTSEIQLVVKLEQLTYIEKQLTSLGINV